MPRQSVFEMPFSKVYLCLVQKAERKGRTAAEVEQVTTWLTGYESVAAVGEVSYGDFLPNAPNWNPNAEKIITPASKYFFSNLKNMNLPE